jgi:D-alanyl-D-alanine carboxypeptidase
MSDCASTRTAVRRCGSAILTAVAVVTATLVGIVLAGPLARPSRADGVVADTVTAFSDDHPAVANLNSDLLRALRRAAADADTKGVAIVVTSGWRSSHYQARLFEDAVLKYGSEAKAARWVASARTSRHVQGDAVDIGRSAAVTWLSKHGARYGLCRAYTNEPWHFELRPDAPARGCPPMYATPAHDPRLQA